MSMEPSDLLTSQWLLSTCWSPMKRRKPFKFVGRVHVAVLLPVAHSGTSR